MKLDEEKMITWTEGILNEEEFPDVMDSDLTLDEANEILRRCQAAVVKKVLARPGVFSFPEHKTLQ